MKAAELMMKENQIQDDNLCEESEDEIEFI